MDFPVDVALAELVPTLPVGAGWRYEMKFDGHRTVVWREKDTGRLQARSGRDVTAVWMDLALAAFDMLPPGVVLDGEAVIYARSRTALPGSKPSWTTVSFTVSPRGSMSKSSSRVRRGRTPGGGTGGIQGGPARLGRPIVAWTGREILHAAGLESAPRRFGPTRREFLITRVEGVSARGFPPSGTVPGGRWYVPAFGEHGTRRLPSTGVTAHPIRARAVHPARILAADLGVRMESPRFLLRDRDGRYGGAFDAVFEAEDLDVIKSAPRAPRRNARCESAIGSIRREALDHVLIVNGAAVRQVLAAYQRHSNAHRPHQARQQLPPDAEERPDATVHDLNARRVLRTQILGGVISEYRYIA
ncbi:integrase core domain-containing protein [Streptomyces sp. NWU339]|uniref:integrase core domain-containing protein n=1 Tax=Streptomyces sp. NWU339 TaxID=2185284 RepID=UPI00215A5F63|nr:integrase core domain-containing protein [Streptomyces sp. NWU339]